MIEENDMTRVIEEIARLSLGMVFDEIGHELDLSDAELLKVRDHLEDKLNAEEAYLDCPQYTSIQKLEAALEATRQEIAETKYLSFRVVTSGSISISIASTPSSMSALLVKEQKLEKAVHLHHEFVFNPKIQQELLAEYKKKVPLQDFRGDKE